MTELSKLKAECEKAIVERDTAEQFSSEWFTAKAKVGRLQDEINEIEFADRQKDAVPVDAVFVDWDSYDD